MPMHPLSPPRSAGRFIKVPGSESIPDGYRVINCQQASASAVSVVRMLTLICNFMFWARIGPRDFLSCISVRMCRLPY